MSSSGAVRKSSSSLSLLIISYFNWHYVIFFFLANVALFTYKSIQFYYPARLLGWDFVTIFLYLAVEATRLLLGKAYYYSFLYAAFLNFSVYYFSRQGK